VRYDYCRLSARTVLKQGKEGLLTVCHPYWFFICMTATINEEVIENLAFI